MKKTLKLCVVAIALALTLALVSCFVNGTTNTYTITYIDAPSHNNPTTYTSNDYIKLQKPIWTGLAFSHWSDENGNVVKEIPRGTNGNITLTANWMYTENMIVSNDSNEMLFSLYDEEHNQRYFVYEIGTMHNVVLDELSAYKYNGATNHSWSISETVSFTESSAYDVAKTIADSVTNSTSWSYTHTDIKEESTNKHQSATLGAGLEIKAIKAKLFEYSNGKDTLNSKGSSDEHYDGGGKDTTHEESKTVSSSISYIKDVSTQVTRTETLDPSITPAGMYRYVQAGSIKVYAIVTYNQDTKDYYINIYSYIDQIYETMLYEPVPEYNNDINIVDCAPFTFDLNIDELAENVIGNAYYVEFNANGGTGSMPTQMIIPNSSAELFGNQFTREGYEFIGWSLVADNMGVIYSDGQIVNGIANAQETITLYAVWSSTTYTIVYDANGGNGTMSSTTHLINCEEKLPTNTYTNYGNLLCWNTEPDGSGTSFFDEAIIYNIATPGNTITLYAMWEELAFALNDDKASYSITGIGNCTKSIMCFPSTYKGLPVTGISSGAFKNCTVIMDIALPDSVTSIGNEAFMNCTSLRYISISASVEIINSATFLGCSSLTHVSFNKNSQLTNIGSRAFLSCTSLAGINIPATVTIIDSYAFNGCTSLREIVIPNLVTSIGDYAFEACRMLTYVTIGSSVKKIGICAFFNCLGLKSIKYNGTSYSWNNIPKGNLWNGNTPNFYIYCNNCTLTKDGAVL